MVIKMQPGSVRRRKKQFSIKPLIFSQAVQVVEFGPPYDYCTEPEQLRLATDEERRGLFERFKMDNAMK